MRSPLHRSGAAERGGKEPGSAAERGGKESGSAAGWLQARQSGVGTVGTAMFRLFRAGDHHVGCEITLPASKKADPGSVLRIAKDLWSEVADVALRGASLMERGMADMTMGSEVQRAEAGWDGEVTGHVINPTSE